MNTNAETFYAYPQGRVIGTFSAAETLTGATEALRAAGIDTAPLEVLCGAEGARILGASGARHGLRARVVRALQSIGEEHERLKKAEADLLAGRFLASVPAADAAEKRRVAELLRANGVSCGGGSGSRHNRAASGPNSERFLRVLGTPARPTVNLRPIGAPGR